ncbi:MAG TPA: hypothetical protein VG939_05525 [Caulobacteraceae bacterium]|nr:hypothetical protein [Caulobacteraceae bacterium]
MTHPYGDPLYAEALSAIGPAVMLPEWGSFALVRPLPGGAGEDATGPYPRTPIAADADLAAGLARLAAEGLVSAVFVPDPLASPDPARLAAAFGLCRPFKTHLTIERARGYEPTRHHRDRIRRGHRRCRVERVDLAAAMPDWRRLYGGLVERHGIAGVAAFADPYFPTLARTPAMVALAAYVGDEIAAMTIWFEHAGVAVSHLTAADALGYANGANYALNDAAIAHFGDAAVIDLGGAAGAADDASDGLFQFKQGFANAQVTAQLCGAILDPARYAALSAGHETGFFPAYRG